MATNIDVTIRTEEARVTLIANISNRELPIRARVSDKLESRSDRQNRWQGMTMSQLGRDGDMSPGEYRAYCKFHIGAPILCRDSMEYKKRFDKFFDNLIYADQLDLAVDFHVTRVMNVKQMTEYMEEIYRHFSAQGFFLKHPDDQGR